MTTVKNDYNENEKEETLTGEVVDDVKNLAPVNISKADHPIVDLYQKFNDGQQNMLDVSDDFTQLSQLVGDPLYERILASVEGNPNLDPTEQASLGLKFMADRRETIKTIVQSKIKDRHEKAKEYRFNILTGSAIIIILWKQLPESVRMRVWSGLRQRLVTFFH